MSRPLSFPQVAVLGFGKCLYVDGQTTLPTAAQDGTFGHPFKTITQAISQAETNGSAGQCAVLGPASYVENLTLPNLDAFELYAYSQWNTSTTNTGASHTIQWTPSPAATSNAINTFRMQGLQ